MKETNIRKIPIILLLLFTLGCQNQTVWQKQNPRFINTDEESAFRYYKSAVDSGSTDNEATKIVFDGYYFGDYVTENKAEAKRYLLKFSDAGIEWAMLLLAYWSEDTEPEKAIELYIKTARKGNRCAQIRLAEIYFQGQIVPQNICKSYFWALLASVGEFEIDSANCHKLFVKTSEPGINNRYNKRDAERIKEKAVKQLYLHNPDYVQLVQDEASKWQKGQPEPDFPIVQTGREEDPSFVKVSLPDSIELSELKNEEQPLKWIPSDINLNTQLEANLTPAEIFSLIDPSIWTVVSASTGENMKAGNNIALGSAIAVSNNLLLTNYHVIGERPYVLIKHGEQFARATIYAGNKQNDRCILIAEDVELIPVKHFKKFDQLSVGDTVYSVGSPQGLENSLGQGIISGKRESGEQAIIQTTAPVSQGSSGGGLFDCSGNLIGITTFKITDGDNLNFAIPIEAFTK